MWILLILLTGLIGYGIYFARNGKGYSADIGGTMITTISILFIVLFLTFWGCTLVDSRLMIINHTTYQQTIESARISDISDYERMALTKEILEYNIKLRQMQYWNDTFWFDMFYFDDIMKLESIQ